MLLSILGAGWLTARIRAGGRYQALRTIPMEGLRFRTFGEPLLLFAEGEGLAARFPLLVHRIRHSLQRTRGLNFSGERTLLFLGEMLSRFWLLAAAGCLLALISGEPAALTLGLTLSVIVPAAMVKELHEQAKRREQQIVMELPELLNGLVLLVGAGETVQRAIIRCAESYSGGNKHPLYKELRHMIAEWEGGFSFQQALEHFSKRCAVQEAALFTTAILLNHRRGGSDFALALRDLSRQLWEKRKALGRTRGEQASAKLVFPMVIIFLIVIILVGAPALMMMNM